MFVFLSHNTRPRQARPLGIRIVASIIILFHCYADGVFALDKSPAAAGLATDREFAISRGHLQTKIETTKSKQGLDEAAKTQLLNQYQAIQDNLDAIDLFNSKTNEYESALKQAPDKLKKLQLDLEQTQQKGTKQKPEDFSKIGDLELEKRLAIEKDKAAKLNEQVSALEKSLAEQNIRPDNIRNDIITARQNLESTQKKLDSRNLVNTSRPEAEALQIYLESQLDLYTTQLKMLSVESNSYSVRLDIIKATLKLLNLQKSQQDSIVSVIESTVDMRRQQEALHMQKQLTEAEKAVAGKPAIIQKITRENVNLSRDLQALNAKIKSYADLKTRLDGNTAAIEADFKSAEKKINLAGVSPVLGKILRKQRRNLFAYDQIATQSDTVQNEIAQASLELFKIEDQLKLLANPEDFLPTVVKQEVDPQLPADERMTIQAELRVLYNSQEDLLNKLSAAYSSYLRTLGDYDFAQQQMLNQADSFAKYLDERMLWVPSSEPFNANFPLDLYKSVRWLFSPRHWLALGKDVVAIVWDNLFLTFLVILASAVFPVSRRWAKQELNTIAGQVGKIHTDKFAYTLRALAYTIVLTLPLPVFAYYLGWFLTIHSGSTDFSKAVGQGLQIAAVPLFAIQFMFRVFAAKGIAVRHFKWQESSASLIHRQTKWLRYVAFAGSFLVGLSNSASSGLYADTLGRVALIVLLTALSLFFSKLLHPSKGLLRNYFPKHPEDWLTKSRHIWYALIVASPIIVIGFAVEGYYLSALELQQQLVVTVRLVFLLILAHELVMRWLNLVNLKIALKNAIQKRKTAALAEKQANPDNIAGDDPTLPVDEQLVDIPATKAQTVKLLQGMIGFFFIVGIWVIWKNILPAFSILDRHVLWHYAVMQDNQQVLQPITLANLIMAGLYGFIMVVTVRNFPGVMELLLFSRMSIAAGGRYAVNQLAKYLIITLGLVLIANALGGSWSQVQWLVAALSVGLGFGLQEIFANLVSGIILLFERPIRVGDTVTIGNVTGKVSRIQMRATTVLDVDKKELIVPNKTFITNQFVNWTLSDSTTRVVIPVVITEGSDVEQAHKTMLEAVKATPLVLEDPAPSVVLTGFSDRGLDYSVRVFVAELANRLPVTHNLHLNIEKMLRDKGIEMAFSQHATKALEIEAGGTGGK